MIDPTDITTLQSMQTKYRDAAKAIADEKTRAVADVEERYRRALLDLEEQRKAKIAKVERQSQADEVRIGQFLGQLDSFLSALGTEPATTTPTA